MSDRYVRQTCLNGHIITSTIGSGDEDPQPFCSRCGEETIIKCPACGKPQMGWPENVIRAYEESPDAFCWNCGKPYPWTERQIAATAELVKEEEMLSEEDKQLLTASLPDLVSDSPRTTLAATRVKRIAGKVGGAFKAALYKFAVDCASETAKKIVTGE
jgi:hypothetical protein